MSSCASGSGSCAIGSGSCASGSGSCAGGSGSVLPLTSIQTCLSYTEVNRKVGNYQGRVGVEHRCTFQGGVCGVSHGESYFIASVVQSLPVL